MSAAVDLLVRATLLATAGWLATVVLRRQSASLRALIWTTTLGGLLVLPALSDIVPAWRVEVWRGPTTASVRAEPMPAPARLPPAVSVPVAAVASSAGTLDAPISLSAPEPNDAEARAGVSWGTAASLLWMVITAALWLRIAASHFRLAQVAKGTSDIEDADADWAELLDETRAALGISRTVCLKISAAVNVPAVAGIWRPVLLLPMDAADWTPDVRRAVVIHELAHVARWDALGQLVSQLACGLYWFIPLVWHGARRAAALRERASDDVVLTAGVRPSTYADNLIRLAQLAGGAELRTAALAMAAPSRMRERVIAILDPVARRNAVTAGTVAAVLIVATTGVTILAAVQPGAGRDPVVTDMSARHADAPAAITVTSPAGDIPLRSTSLRVEPSTPPKEGPSTALRASGEQPAGSVAEPAAVVTTDQQASARLCGRGLDKSSSSIHDDNNRRRWTVKLAGPGCTVDLRAEGKFEFTADFTDISSIPAGGFFRIDVTEHGVRRELEIEPKNGTLTRIWRVDGRERSYDAEARAWFAAFLIELDRRTAIGVDIRLPLMLRQGGVDTVLKETTLMSSDYARGQYYTKLARSTKLTAPELTRLLTQAASLTESDHYASELLRAIAGHGLEDTAVRTAAIKLIDGMESDHYRAESISVLIAGGRPTANEMAMLLQTLPRMESDHYKVDVLKKVLVSGKLDEKQQVALARAAADVESDHYAAEFLKTLSATGPMTAAVRQAFVEAVGRIDSDHYAADVLGVLIKDHAPSSSEVDLILQLLPSVGSDHYRGEVVARLVATPQLTERDLLRIIEATRVIRSEHHRSEALRRVAGHRSANDRVGQAVIAAADGLSRHYADEVRRAVKR